ASPAPSWAQQKLVEHLNYANQAPPYHMWQLQEPNREIVRARLAREFGCDTAELAITRNASESLMICQFGFDLRAGDEVLTSNQDYPRMLNAFRQRVRRDGVVLREISLPGPEAADSEVVAAFAAAITDKTRLLLCCHMINLTGRILPVHAIVAMARARSVPVIVDGAHALAHFPFQLRELDCDYYASSLHKWLSAPIGAGLLYVRRDKIPGLWPMMAAGEQQRDDIRKFEEIGTHPAGNFLAVAEALTFHQTLGGERKAARLRLLRDRWTSRLLANDRVSLHTSLQPGRACGIANFAVRDLDATKLGDHLWDKHRILVTPIAHADCAGIRVSPAIFTTLEELDRFGDAVEQVLQHGLPS
ncbi:MAG TPA: aminotransferase class V-fold PLP-dependent enzyme, partial [Planctomycetota bacterium]|nr:aminotransferase class V-fold PLP-dependent enzyme [Planctomycetota bacterium]